MLQKSIHLLRLNLTEFLLKFFHYLNILAFSLRNKQIKKKKLNCPKETLKEIKIFLLYYVKYLKVISQNNRLFISTYLKKSQRILINAYQLFKNIFI